MINSDQLLSVDEYFHYLKVFLDHSNERPMYCRIVLICRKETTHSLRQALQVSDDVTEPSHSTKTTQTSGSNTDFNSFNFADLMGMRKLNIFLSIIIPASVSSTSLFFRKINFVCCFKWLHQVNWSQILLGSQSYSLNEGVMSAVL